MANSSEKAAAIISRRPASADFSGLQAFVAILFHSARIRATGGGRPRQKNPKSKETKTMNGRITPRLIPVLVALGFSGTAAASGFQLLEQNASGIGNSYAGSAAVAENASTIFFNPAGMTKLQAREYSLGLAAVRPSFEFSDKGSVIAPATGTGSDDAGNWAYIPNGYMSWALNKDIYLGIGFSAPFGLMTEYDPTWVGQFQAIKFDIKTYNINPSIAYRVNDQVSIGFGINWQRMEAEYQRQAAVANAATRATRIKLVADDDTWGWNAGVLFDLSPATRLGLSYRSSVKHTLEGDLTSTNQAVSANVKAKADIELPDTFIASMTHQLNDKWTLLGDVSWTGWSKVDQVDIVRASGAAPGSVAQTLDTLFRDTWRVALGGTYRYRDDLDLKLGIAYDQSPVRSAAKRLVSLPDNDRLWISGGAQWKVAKNGRLDIGAAYLYVRDTDIDNDQSAITKLRGHVIGSYDSSVLILGAQFSNSF